MDSPWHRACASSELPDGGVKLFVHGRDRVALFRVDGAVLAVDDRCPHEGYPLSQGARAGHTLTCCWHNYKFDLRDGACIKGEEAVRTYVVREVDGDVEVDLSPPDLSAQVPGMWESLDGAVHAHRIGQAARDAARLLSAGVPPAALCAWVAGFDGRRAEWGATHVLPLAADLLLWTERYEGPRFAIPLAQALELAARGCVRRPERPLATPVDPGDDPVAAGEAVRTYVEAEDFPAAEALVQGALAKGWRRELVPWFDRLCCDHFLSFGHRLIYQTKVFELLDAADWAHADAILSGHLFGIVNGTREDVLPAWKGFRSFLGRLHLPTLRAAAGTDPDWDGRAPLAEAVAHGKPREALQAVVDALEAGAPLERICDALSLAAAERLLRFDVAIDSDPSCQDTWLSVTHIQTFAHAVRLATRRFADPDVVKLLLQAARFCNHHRVLDGERHAPALDGDPWPELMDVVIGDAFAQPIVSAHAVKNLVVGHAEWRITGDPRPMQAVLRLLGSPLQQRWTHRAALEGVAFVTEGRIPRLLAP